MREIKYRAWEKNLKQIIPVYNINFESKQINTGSAWRFFDEIELMQYTGLKDRNGNEIFEGDILLGVKNFKVTPIKILWNKDKCFYQMSFLNDFDIKNLTKNDIDNSIVIGNVYENKDFIKEGEI